MYSVSAEYIAALRKPYRVDKVEGTITLYGGTVIAITDDVIVRNKLSITRKVCGSSFDVGTFNAAELAITIKDSSAYEHNYHRARVSLTYSIRTAVTEDGGEVWESVPLGVFWVDGQQTTRVKDVVYLRAYDRTLNFDIEFTPYSTVTTLWGALSQACARAKGTQLGITEEEFLQLPNSSITPDITSEQIQSCRDLVMWIAQTTNSYAYIDRNDTLVLKRYYYKGGGMSESDGDRIIRAEERKSIEFTDVRTYLSYLTSYSGGSPKLYHKEREFDDPTGDYFASGTLALPKNPLLQSLTAAEQDTINSAYLNNSSYPTRYIKMTGRVDPSIDLLDLLGFKGGNIDLESGIISVVTEIRWKYRSVGTLICNNFQEYNDNESQSAIATLSDDGAESEAPLSSQVKSQTEKRMDGLEAKLGDGTATKLQTTDSALAVTTSKYGVSMENADGENMGSIIPESGGLRISGKTTTLIALPKEFTVYAQTYGININPTAGTVYLDVDDDGLDFRWPNGRFRFSPADGSIHINESTTSRGGTLSFKNGELYVGGKRVLTEDDISST
ncbi:MAG: hypothetical protein E7485_08510 [Ruminococcaceae bacterium]|nr:hypothetical protein [Oscillospiraceae bacterium]